jgi:hypothetical protein
MPSRWRDDLDDDAPIFPKLRRERTIEVNHAKAQIWLACKTLRPHMAVLVLNDVLREQLDRLAEEEC